MKQHSEAFIGFDTAKKKPTPAIATRRPSAVQCAANSRPYFVGERLGNTAFVESPLVRRQPARKFSTPAAMARPQKVH